MRTATGVRVYLQQDNVIVSKRSNPVSRWNSRDSIRHRNVALNHNPPSIQLWNSVGEQDFLTIGFSKEKT